MHSLNITLKDFVTADINSSTLLGRWSPPRVSRRLRGLWRRRLTSSASRLWLCSCAIFRRWAPSRPRRTRPSSSRCRSSSSIARRNLSSVTSFWSHDCRRLVARLGRTATTDQPLTATTSSLHHCAPSVVPSTWTIVDTNTRLLVDDV